MPTRTGNRTELARFLRSRREALTPAQVGLPPAVRRRTPGLRRDEVAELASMSTNYYGRLEQARGPRPSPTVLDAIAGGFLFRAAAGTPTGGRLTALTSRSEADVTGSS